MAEKTSPFLEMNAAPLPPRRRHARMLGVVIALILLAVLSAALWYRLVWSDLIRSAVIDGVRTAVVASNDGLVSGVSVQLGQHVTQGQSLISLRPVPGSGGEADARAALETMRIQLTTVEHAERRAREDVEQASLAHAQALVALRASGQPVPGSRSLAQSTQRMQEDERKSRSALDGAKARLESASSSRQANERAYRQIRDALLRAESRQGETGQQTQPEQSVITAPAGGRVGVLAVEQGMPVSRGQTLAVIESALPEHLWVTGYVSPSRLTDLSPEQVFIVGLRDGGADQSNTPQLTARIEAVLPMQPGGNASGVPVRLRLMGYDPLRMPALVPGQRVDLRLQ